MTRLTNNTSILLATFSPWKNGKRLPTNGTLDPIREFLVPKIGTLVIIDQVLPGSDFLLPRIEVFKSKKKKVLSSSIFIRIMLPLLKLFDRPGTQIVFKIRDFFSVIDWVIRSGDRYEVFIGMESVNALAGVLMRKFGRIDTVVYYVSDYSPNRYPNKLFNAIYVSLDRMACRYADYIWDVSKAMMPARILAGLDPTFTKNYIHVPNGLYDDQIVKRLVKQTPNTLVFMGTLGEENGPDLIIEALPKIKKQFSNVHYHVIGGGNVDIDRLEKLAVKLDVKKNITLHGFVQKSGDMTKILQKCTIAVAPYRAIPGSPRYYADAGKIRIYAAAGVPILCSDVPPLGKEVANAGGAIVIKDSAASFSNAIIKLLSDSKRHTKIRLAAWNYAKNSTWDETLSNAFASMK